jgi:hypothetical protein
MIRSKKISIYHVFFCLEFEFGDLGVQKRRDIPCDSLIHGPKSSRNFFGKVFNEKKFKLKFYRFRALAFISIFESKCFKIFIVGMIIMKIFINIFFFLSLLDANFFLGSVFLNEVKK